MDTPTYELTSTSSYDLWYGHHVRKEGSFTDSVKRVLDYPINCYQMYCCNSRSFGVPKASVLDLKEARRLLEMNNKKLFIHASLLYNLCGSADHEDSQMEMKKQRVVNSLTAELDLGVMLGAGVVVHIGSCKDRDQGFANIVETIEKCLSGNGQQTLEFAKSLGISVEEFKKRRRLLLENAAGKGKKTGNKIGSTLLEIQIILDSVKDIDPALSGSLGVCIDTAHTYGAGIYDFGNPKETTRFVKEFDELIGLSRLWLIHLNDSCAGHGSHRDLHANLGSGNQFKGNRLLGLQELLTHLIIQGVPIIGETASLLSDLQVINVLLGLDTETPTQELPSEETPMAD